jgi:hypothetical protein
LGRGGGISAALEEPATGDGNTDDSEVPVAREYHGSGVVMEIDKRTMNLVD